MTPEELKAKYLTGDFKLKGEFSSSTNGREEVMDRCERYAGWTIPSVFPDEPLQEYDEMQNDYQSVGAAATNNLANKLMMALFQPSKPFFKLSLTKEQKESIRVAGISEAQIDAALAQAERNSMKTLDKWHARVVLFQAMLLLIITGNALVHLPRDKKMKLFSIRDYLIERDLHGDPTKILIRETKAVSKLPDHLANLAQTEGYNENDDISIYTCIKRVGADKFIVWQELEDVCYCHNRMGVYTADDLPWIPLAWQLNRDKDYGTGLVENYAGDFHSLSTLAEAILDFTTVVTDVKNLVDPAGMTDARELAEAASGAYVHGREEDISSYSADVFNATEFLQNRFDSVERRIAAAFLLNTLVTRDAERVTAEEIRMQANELESSLGGVYSRLATELQLPLAKRLLKEQGDVFKDVEPVIVTGLESLSRNSELDNLRGFFNDLISLAEIPEEVADRIDYPSLIAMLGAGHGVEYNKVLLDEDTVQQKRAERAQQQAQAAGLEAAAVTQGQGQ